MHFITRSAASPSGPGDLVINHPLHGNKATLNPLLVQMQSLSSENIHALKATHAIRTMLFEQILAAVGATALLGLARLHDQIEALQQQLWGFEVTLNHRRWFDVPHCRCPKGANDRLMGKPVRIVDVCCPVHSQLLVPGAPKEEWGIELPSFQVVVRLDDSLQGRQMIAMALDGEFGVRAPAVDPMS